MKFLIGDTVRITDVSRAESGSVFAQNLNATGKIIDVPNFLRDDYTIKLDDSSIVEEYGVNTIYCKEYELTFVYTIADIFDIDI